MSGISRHKRKQNQHRKKNTVEAKHQSSPIAMLISVWCLLSIKEMLYSGIVDPVEEPSIGLCLKPLSHSEEEGVGKKEDQKC